MPRVGYSGLYADLVIRAEASRARADQLEAEARRLLGDFRGVSADIPGEPRERHLHLVPQPDETNDG